MKLSSSASNSTTNSTSSWHEKQEEMLRETKNSVEKFAMSSLRIYYYYTQKFHYHKGFARMVYLNS